MATATFVKSARKDIYSCGKRVELVHQKGKHAGEKYSKIDRTQPRDENDSILIRKGESYWTWCFMNQSPNYSRTKPRPSQLTNSSFLSTYYNIQEQIEDFNASEPEEVEEFVQDIISQLEELRDQCQDSLDNMPESLQESDTGQLLQERIDECESLISDFENIDTEYCEDDTAEDDTAEDDTAEDEVEEDEADTEDDAKEEWLENVIAEIQDVSFNL